MELDLTHVALGLRRARLPPFQKEVTNCRGWVIWWDWGPGVTKVLVGFCEAPKEEWNSDQE